MEREKDILQISIRLFIAAAEKWGLSIGKCAELFDKYEIDEYIETCYDFFHIQGDNANLTEIEHYLEGKGYCT